MNASPVILLHRHHQRARWTGALWVATAGLALDLNLAGWGIEPRLRAWGLALTACFVLWARVRHRAPLRGTARVLDARLGTHNRLEALAEREASDDPVASALRAETEIFLREH